MDTLHQSRPFWEKLIDFFTTIDELLTEIKGILIEIRDILKPPVPPPVPPPPVKPPVIAPPVPPELQPIAVRLDQVIKGIELLRIAAPFTIPLDSELLNRQMQGVAPELVGALLLPNYRVTIMVPAGITVRTVLTIPIGFVCTRTVPLDFISTYYHKDITINVWVDKVRVNPYPLPLTGPFSINLGIQYIKREAIEIEIINATTVDIEVTYHVLPHLMRSDVFEKWFSPLLKLGYDMLTKVKELGIPVKI